MFSARLVALTEWVARRGEAAVGGDHLGAAGVAIVTPVYRPV